MGWEGTVGILGGIEQEERGRYLGGMVFMVVVGMEEGMEEDMVVAVVDTEGMVVEEGIGCSIDATEYAEIVGE